MKKTKKQFAVKLWLEIGACFTTIVEAYDTNEALCLAEKQACAKFGEHCTIIASYKVKEFPTCVIRTAFGHIPVKATLNRYYDDEIIINGDRINLPNEFCYWDINSITIHNAGLPTIATITTDKHKFVVQSNTIGCGKRFEIIK